MNEYNRMISKVIVNRIMEFSNKLFEKDKYIFQHSMRVFDYCYLMGFKLGLSKEEIETLCIAAFYHDIGRITASHNNIKKMGFPFYDVNTTTLTHPRISAGLLRTAGGSKEAIKVVACHHERYDGAGYPYGLVGKNIPLLARVLTIADMFDVMMTSRHPSVELSRDEAMHRLIADCGTRYDTNLVYMFLDLIIGPYEQQLEAV